MSPLKSRERKRQINLSFFIYRYCTSYLASASCTHLFTCDTSHILVVIMILWKVGEESPFSNYSEAYKLAECDFVPFHGSAFLFV